MEPSLKVMVCVVFILITTPLTPNAREVEELDSPGLMFNEREIKYMASILAGETAYGCDQCHEWIACTIKRDAVKRKQIGLSVWSLHPGRWRGFRQNPSKLYIDIMWKAAVGDYCNEAPRCKFVGNANDYRYNWTRYGDAVITGNKNGLVVCVPENEENDRNDLGYRRSLRSQVRGPQ